MKNKLIFLETLLVLIIFVFTGCTEPTQLSAPTDSALPEATSAMLPGESAIPNDGTAKDFISVSDVPSGESGELKIRDKGPSQSDIADQIKSGGAYLSIVRNMTKTVTYELDQFPYINSMTYSDLAAETAKRGTTLEALNLNEALNPSGSIEQHYFIVTDEAVIETFENKVLTLEFRPTNDAAPQELRTEYLFTDEKNTKASYTIFIDGLVMKTCDSEKFLATKRIDIGTAVYFYSISLGYSRFCDGTLTMYCVDDPNTSRIMILRDDKQFILDQESSAAFLTLLCGEGNNSFEMYTTRGVNESNDSSGKKELFRFFPVSRREGSEADYADPPGEQDTWFRFYDDGTVGRFLNNLVCIYGSETILVLYVNVGQTIASQFGVSEALEIVGISQ